MDLIELIEGSIHGLVDSWSVYTTALLTLLVGLVTFRIMIATEPDVHPMLLARQAVASPVRREGESAVFRSQGAPHSMPLLAGLNIKEEGAGKWSRGRVGDLRDVWRRAALGGENGAKGRLLTVHGSEKVVEHKLEDITRQINLIGQHISDQGGIRVAVYLPNSVELLASVFACSFSRNLTTVLIPFDVSSDELVSMLRRSAVDSVITAPGAFPFDAVVGAYPALRQVVWVVDPGSSHMDWNEVPEGVGGSINVATWQDIINDAPADAGAELPAADPANTPMDVVTFWRAKPGQLEEMVRFSQSNLASGIAGQLAAIPTTARLGPADLFLPASSLASAHTLVLTMAALFSNASVALNSVAEQAGNLDLATRGVSPTVMVASPGTLLNTYEESIGKLTSALARVSHALSTRSLTRDGVLSTSNPLASFAASARPSLGTKPGKLRLLYVADRAGTDGPRLSSKVLSDLRVFTGSRIVYAMAAARVAGSVTQTQYFDYRVDDAAKGHFGAPLTNLEVFMKDQGAYKTTDEVAQGEIWVRGPSVAGGEASVGAVGKMLNDYTLAYV